MQYKNTYNSINTAISKRFFIIATTTIMITP